MVMGMVGFADGYRKQQDAGERKRLELAKAFQEFQQSNPEATAMEFQAFMDSMSNGDNYLRGGMPSGGALQAVVGESERRRKEGDEDRNYKMMERNIGLQQSLEGTATGIMMNYADPGPNGYSQADYAAMSQDLQQRFPGVDLAKVGFDPQNMFSNERRANAISMKIQTYLPTVRDMIKSTGGQNVTPDQLKKMGIPTALISPLIDQAKVMDGEVRYDWANTHRKDIYQHALTAVAAGQDNIYDTLVEVYGEDKLPAKDSDYMVNMEARAQAENQKIQADDSTKRRTAVEAFITSKTNTQSFKSSVARLSREKVLENLAKQLPQADYDIAAMFGKKEDGTGVTRADVIANPEKYLGAHMDGAVSEMSIVQGHKSDERRLAAESTANESAKEYKQEQKKIAEKYFGEASSKNVASLLGKNGQDARLAALQLAEEYSMTPRVLSAMEEVFRGLDKEESVAAVKQAVKSSQAFINATGGRTIVDDANQVREETINRTVGPEITSFPDYIADEDTNITEGFGQANEELEAIWDNYKEDPKRAIELYRLLREEINNQANKTIEAWDRYEQLNITVNDGLGWVELGSDERYDPNEIKKLEDNLTNRVSNFNSSIDHEIAKAEKLLQAQANVDASGVNVGVDALSEGNWATEKLKDVGGSWLAEQILTDAVGEFSFSNPVGGFINAVGSLADSEIERDRSKKVSGWYDANHERLIEYAEMYRQQNGDNSVLERIAKDIKTMTAEQLDAKYSKALRELGDNRQLVPTQ